jgi:hypothetical protein
MVDHGPVFSNLGEKLTQKNYTRTNNIKMRVYYFIQHSNGRPFPKHKKVQTWTNVFPTSVSIEEMKDKLGLWHALDPSSLTMYESFQSCKADEEVNSRFGSSVEFPLIVSVDEGKNRETSTESTSSKLPINRVLQYLVTKDKKYKPIVYAI